MNLHPDDVLFFNEVCDAMRKVAARYELPLRNITPATMPEEGMAEYLGRCFSSGDIELVMRATVNGKFCDAPRTPADVWRTAAHELAHLKYMNHGQQFHEFFAELVRALDNREEDHRERVIRKLVKMQQLREGEAKAGNMEAAENFAAMINRMLVENELHPSDLDYARTTDNDPIVELMVDLKKYAIDSKKVRIAWQEALARIVAKAHLCTFLIRQRSNQIWFVGTKSHATVAEYVFGTLVPIANQMSIKEKYKYGAECFKRDGHWRGVNGFREAWLDAFIKRIAERFDDARKAAVKESVTDLPAGSESQALMRLDGALIKVQRYVDDKFSGRRRRAHALESGRAKNSEGTARGRAAADQMTIGRRGINASSVRGTLK